MLCMGLSCDTAGTPTVRMHPGPAAGEIDVWRGLERAVAFAFSIPLYELRATQRRRAPVAFARQVTMYIAHVVFGLSFCEIGRLCHRDRRTVAHACGVVEGRRDDPSINGVLDLLESFGRALATKAADSRGPAR